MREVEPERVVASQAVTAATAEDDVEDGEFLGDGGGPAEEDVGDDAEFMIGLIWDEDVLDEVFEVWFEGGGGFDESNDEVVGYGVGVFCVWWEAVIGGSERDFEEGYGGVSWERGSYFFNV